MKYTYSWRKLQTRPGHSPEAEGRLAPDGDLEPSQQHASKMIPKGGARDLLVLKDPTFVSIWLEAEVGTKAQINPNSAYSRKQPYIPLIMNDLRTFLPSSCHIWQVFLVPTHFPGVSSPLPLQNECSRKGFPYQISLGNSGLTSETGFFVQDFSKLSTC